MEGLYSIHRRRKGPGQYFLYLGREDKVALVGPNELAKTTLFKILSGEMEPDSGSYKWGLRPGLFPQGQPARSSTTTTIVAS